MAQAPHNADVHGYLAKPMVAGNEDLC